MTHLSWCIPLLFFFTTVFAQSPSDSLLKQVKIIKKDSAVSKHDTVFKHEDIAFQGKDTIIHKKDSIYRRALANFDASSVTITNEAVRAYASPMTFSSLMEQMNGAYPLMQSDQGYGRESFLITHRTSEPLAASFLEGVLPLNDPLTGNTTLNFFPLEIASMISIESGGMLSSADHASSDAINFSLERFRAPIPYSRFHYTQELGNALSNFEGIFSINPSEPMNVAFAVYHRSAGRAQSSQDFTFDPRVEHWWVRGQGTYDTKTFNALLYMLYTSAFSGMNGGIISRDSVTDIFDAQLASVKDPLPFDHRTRLDVLGQLGFSLFSEKERTMLSAYSTTSARRLLARDSTFPSYAGDDLAKAQRLGLSLIQPASLEIGSFITRATIRGDFSYLKSGKNTGLDMTETRLSAMGSDSISISGLFGISISGFLRGTLSKLSVEGIKQSDLFFTNLGLEASAKLTEALKITAQANYSRDRASMSPTPTATYELKNIGAFANISARFGARERFALSVGYLDRHEPEGVYLESRDGSDSNVTPVFSSTDIHSTSIRANMDVWFSTFRYSLQTIFFPATIPLANYTTNASLRSDLSQRIQSAMGLYYEDEIAEGNLRMSIGPRVRYMNTLSPSLTYDPFSDYYIYRGLPRRGDSVLNDSRLTQPKFIFDLLVSTTIDQRATVNVSFLNVLGTPYYNVGIYPRSGFQFRLDVTWAFLD